MLSKVSLADVFLRALFRIDLVPPESLKARFPLGEISSVSHSNWLRISQVALIPLHRQSVEKNTQNEKMTRHNSKNPEKPQLSSRYNNGQLNRPGWVMKLLREKYFFRALLDFLFHFLFEILIFPAVQQRRETQTRKAVPENKMLNV